MKNSLLMSSWASSLGTVVSDLFEVNKTYDKITIIPGWLKIRHGVNDRAQSPPNAYRRVTKHWVSSPNLFKNPSSPETRGYSALHFYARHPSRGYSAPCRHALLKPAHCRTSRALPFPRQPLGAANGFTRRFGEQ